MRIRCSSLLRHIEETFVKRLAIGKRFSAVSVLKMARANEYKES